MQYFYRYSDFPNSPLERSSPPIGPQSCTRCHAFRCHVSLVTLSPYPGRVPQPFSVICSPNGGEGHRPSAVWEVPLISAHLIICPRSDQCLQYGQDAPRRAWVLGRLPGRHLASVSSRASDVTYDSYLLKLLSGLFLPKTEVSVWRSWTVQVFSSLASFHPVVNQALPRGWQNEGFPTSSFPLHVLVSIALERGTSPSPD